MDDSSAGSARQYDVILVGAGHIAEIAHLPAIEAQGDRVRLAAVVDVDGDRARQFAKASGAPHSYTRLDDALAGEKADLVIVATPPSAHGPAVRTSLQAGAWVYCEKPPVLSLAEYDEILSHEKERGPYVEIVFQSRFGSGGRTLREQVRSGALGRPLHAVCHTLWYRDDAYYEVPWRGKWETEGGGPTMGHGVHQIDLLLSVLGDWYEVYAELATLQRHVATEDCSLAIVKFDSGAIASIVTSVLAPRQETYLRFDFTDATVELTHLYSYDNSNWTWTPSPAAKVPDSSVWLPTDNIRSVQAAQLTKLIESMDAGTRPEVSGPAGRQALELVTAIYQSGIERRPVKRAELVPGNPFYERIDGGGRYSPSGTNHH